MRNNTQKLVLSAFFLVLSVVLPLFFHLTGITQFGKIFLPMHLPVLLCSFICGYTYGGIVGLLAPYMSSLIMGMPVLFPVAIYMSFELMTYGIIGGLMYKKFNILLSLSVALIIGRIVLAFSMWVLLSLSGNTFVFASFIGVVTVTAIPGILLQYLVVPAVVLTLKKTPMYKTQTTKA